MNMFLSLGAREENAQGLRVTLKMFSHRFREDIQGSGVRKTTTSMSLSGLYPFNTKGML